MPKIKRKIVGECPCPHVGCGELCEVKRINDVGNYFLNCTSHGVLRYKGIHDFVLDHASLANPDGSMPGEKEPIAVVDFDVNTEVSNDESIDTSELEVVKASVTSIDKNKKEEKPKQEEKPKYDDDWFGKEW